MYIADLHIHSRFSMATSRQLTVPHLAGWAMCKGINVLGTGDFTHPRWQAELEENLVYDEESGFYRGKGRPDPVLSDKAIPNARPPLFCLQTEISSIYKKGGKSRRIHNLVFFRHLDDVKKFSAKLAQIGNIQSDGRPILGLDARDLLELVLETSPDGILIPAHIWTPWFSLFGSKSGFDAIEECFGDLTSHIFALETGLSSDPAMNRLLSALDGYALISNSDAHSGANLGREANLFSGSPSYDGMFGALRRTAARKGQDDLDEAFLGTLEIYPEEGKYHLDGHRNCHVVMTPQESIEHGNICPVCGKPLTIGVLHRVWELADRTEAPVLVNEPAVHPILPLPAVLAQINGLAPKSKAVKALFQKTLEQLGGELGILAGTPLEAIAACSPLLAEAVRRIRSGEIELAGGYDGEFGTITVFTEEELRDLKPSSSKLVARGRPKAEKKSGTPARVPAGVKAGSLKDVKTRPEESAAGKGRQKLTAEQEKACAHQGGPVLVLAGPGSGKTRLLAERIARLVEQGVQPSSILALTFSRRAAEVMEERLCQRLGAQHETLPFCGTFHALAWKLLRRRHPDAQLMTDAQARRLLDQAIADAVPLLDKKQHRVLAEKLELLRERCEMPGKKSLEQTVIRRYAELKAAGGVRRVDFPDLLEGLTQTLSKGMALLKPEHLLVDEVQDLSRLQVRLLEALAQPEGRGFFGIGDPDQSIYGFRGAVPDIMAEFRGIWPDLAIKSLNTSFRSSQKILDAAGLTRPARSEACPLKAAGALGAELTAFEAPSSGLEYSWIADQILRLLPASSHTLLDEQKKGGTVLTGALVPSEIAILVRLRAQIPPLAKALFKRGIPVQAPALDLFWQDEAVSNVLPWIEERISGGSGGMGLAPLAGEKKNTAAPAELLPQLRAAGLDNGTLAENEAWTQLEKAYAEAGNWEQLLESVRWQKEADLLRSKAESVRLLTMHAAKGLEFTAVFLSGFNDGIMPLDRQMLAGKEGTLNEGALAEERRLLYVSLTRASQAVFVSWSRENHVYGRDLELPPSRFWPDMAGLFSRRKLVRHERSSMVEGRLI